ncbi:hypothetical protein L9F63_028083, partial [Diploptera punctata]
RWRGTEGFGSPCGRERLYMGSSVTNELFPISDQVFCPSFVNLLPNSIADFFYISIFNISK